MISTNLMMVETSNLVMLLKPTSPDTQGPLRKFSAKANNSAIQAAPLTSSIKTELIASIWFGNGREAN